MMEWAFGRYYSCSCSCSCPCPCPEFERQFGHSRVGPTKIGSPSQRLAPASGQCPPPWPTRTGSELRSDFLFGFARCNQRHRSTTTSSASRQRRHEEVSKLILAPNSV